MVSMTFESKGFEGRAAAQREEDFGLCADVELSA